MGAKFDALYTKFQEVIQAKREKFEEFNSQHVGEIPAKIFDTYWSLEGSSNSFEGEQNEKITLEHRDAYNILPQELKSLIS